MNNQAQNNDNTGGLILSQKEIDDYIRKINSAGSVNSGSGTQQGFVIDSVLKDIEWKNKHQEDGNEPK